MPARSASSCPSRTSPALAALGPAQLLDRERRHDGRVPHLTGLELDEVIALWLSFDDYRRRPGFTLSASSLGNIIEAELGVTVELDE